MLVFENLSVGYNGKTVIENVSLSLNSGELLILLGANGSGKSTLLKTVAGILSPVNGKVYIEGTDISKYSSKELAKKVSYLSQINRSSDLTVRQLVLHGRFPYLSFPRKYRRCDRRIAEEAIETMGLEREIDKPVSLLSGGTLQKAYIAMSLAQETNVLLLDEPTAFLDIRAQLQLLKVIRQLKDSGKTVIMILHDIPMAMQYADSIAVLHEGKVLSVGSPEEILEAGSISHAFGINIQKINNSNQQGYLYCPEQDDK